MLLPQVLFDLLEHALEALQNLIVPEANDAITADRQRRGSRVVSPYLYPVLAPIDFNDELADRASEVDDVFADRMLTAKANVRKLLAKRPPQAAFGVGRIAP
jgi:hypothetical protein